MALGHFRCFLVFAASLPLFGLSAASWADDGVSSSAAEAAPSAVSAPAVPDTAPAPAAPQALPSGMSAEENDKLAEQMIQNILQGKSEISDEQLAILTKRAHETMRLQQEQQKRDKIHQFAVAFYALIQTRDLDNIPKLCVPDGLYFENRKSASADEQLKEFTRIFNNPRLQNANLARVQIFSADEMMKHFGERPAHLSDWPIDDTKYFSLGQLGDQIIIVLWKASGDLFLAEAIHG